MNFIEEIVSHVIRPEREVYDIRRLGDKNIYLRSKNGRIKRIVRDDFQLKNQRGQNLQVSYYRHTQMLVKDCVIYLHANNGSRIQPLNYLNVFFESDINFCTIDLAGSGISGGEWISLGLNEAADIKILIDELYRIGIRNVVLWGRSMGAVSALIYSSLNHRNTIRGLILDSPFKDLSKLIKQIASNRTGLPQIFFQPLLFFVDSAMKQRLNVSLDHLKIKQYLVSDHFINIPALFLTSTKDRLVGCHHVQKLHHRYRGPKQLIYMQIQHHAQRKLDLLMRCYQFVNFMLKDKRQTIGENLNLSRTKIKEAQGFSSKNSSNNFSNLNKISLSALQRRMDKHANTNQHCLSQDNMLFGSYFKKPDYNNK